MKTIKTFEEFVNESFLNEENDYNHNYQVKHKIDDVINLPHIGECKVIEVGFKPTKIYKYPWSCKPADDFNTFEPLEIYLKTTHKPQSIGSNAIRLESLDQDKYQIMMYQYTTKNNKVYTQYTII
jgi:hypothetical protein